MTATTRRVKTQRVPVSERALVQRINRKLAKDDEQLRATRPGTKAESDLGRYYVHGLDRNTVVAMHVDVQKMGRELEVLADWEELIERSNPQGRADRKRGVKPRRQS